MSGYSFLTELSESRLFPSVKALDRLARPDLAELTHLYLCALRILLRDPHSAGWARQYVRRTLHWGGFTRWRNDATDLYVLLHALSTKGDGVSTLFHQTLLRWLRAATTGDGEHETEARRVLVRLDLDLGVKDGSMRAIRRLVMDWPVLTRREQRLVMTRLLQFLRSRAAKAEVLPYLNRVAGLRNLEIKGACNLETGAGCYGDSRPALPLGFLAGLAGRRLGETATSGATSAASVATVAGGLGVGFDPDGDTGIYPKKPKSKPILLKR